MTTYQDLDAFAARVESTPAWTHQLSLELHALIAPVALSLEGRALKPPTPSNCFDSLLPWKPRGWKREMNELPLGARASFVKFQSATQAGPVRVMSCETKKLCATTTLAVVAITARAWSYELNPTQDWVLAAQRQIATV